MSWPTTPWPALAATLSCAAGATAILLWYLFRRPALTRSTKTWLMLGLGVFPIGAAFLGNATGLEHSQHRHFCGSCHLMEPYLADALEIESPSLASIHSRNAMFGHESCFSCHANYGMYGSVVTKAEGLRHFWAYYTRSWPANAPLSLYRPFPNATCRQCHSGKLAGFNDEPEHAAASGRLKDDALSCAAAGCHAPAHAGGARPEAAR